MKYPSPSQYPDPSQFPEPPEGEPKTVAKVKPIIPGTDIRFSGAAKSGG